MALNIPGVSDGRGKYGGKTAGFWLLIVVFQVGILVGNLVFKMGILVVNCGGLWQELGQEL